VLFQAPFRQQAKAGTNHIAGLLLGWRIPEGLAGLHGPPKKSKFLRYESSKGLLPYIRAVCAVLLLPMMAFANEVPIC